MSRYLIAIIPPEPIAGEIYKLKEYFRDHYQSRASLNSPAHITMHMPFDWDETKEQQLFEALPLVRPFDVELRNFGCFEPRVIFIDVVKNEALSSAQARLLEFCRARFNLFNANYKDHPFHPHVTIAFRDLKRERFASGWREFRMKSYYSRFECTRLSLLKHDGKNWRDFS